MSLTVAPRLVDPRTSEGTEYVRALDRGLAVIRAFDREHPRRTLAEVARAVGLAPATARRLLHTLQSLDYVVTDGQTWSLRPRERLTRLAADVEETASAGVLEGSDVLYTVRVPYRRIMSMNVEVGTRIPAYASSMGRVLLAGLPTAELDDVLAGVELAPITPQTLTSVDQLRAVVDDVRESGVCVLEQELEAGVQCVAAPVHDRDGGVVAAVTVSSHTTRVTPEELRGRLLPAVLQAAADITEDLRHRG
jgi:IclR family pca regulon transcriptional regulator